MYRLLGATPTGSGTVPAVVTPGVSEAAAADLGPQSGLVAKWTYFCLYVTLDILSRSVVRRMVAEKVPRWLKADSGKRAASAETQREDSQDC